MGFTLADAAMMAFLNKEISFERLAEIHGQAQKPPEIGELEEVTPAPAPMLLTSDVPEIDPNGCDGVLEAGAQCPGKRGPSGFCPDCLVKYKATKKPREYKKTVAPSCTGTTRDGQPCGNYAVTGTDRCNRHPRKGSEMTKKPGKRYCREVLAKGTGCSYLALPGSDYCGHHPKKT